MFQTLEPFPLSGVKYQRLQKKTKRKKQRSVKGDIEAHIIDEFHHAGTALGG